LLLAIVPATVFILILPINFDRYIIEPVTSYDHRFYCFLDLEIDGEKEKLSFGVNPDSSLYLRISNDDDQNVDQFNFSHTMFRSTTPHLPISVDLTGNQKREIIFLSMNEDSVFLNVFSFTEMRSLINPVFVSTIGGINEKSDFQQYWIGHFDATGDNIPEVYFTISSGFALYPRRLYRFDFKSQQVKASINTGAAKFRGALAVQGDQARICVTGSARGNTRKDYPCPYHDTTCWFMVFDADLELVNEPVAMGGFLDHVSPPEIIGEHAYIVLHSDQTDAFANRIVKADLDGHFVDSLPLAFPVFADLKKYAHNGKIHYAIYDDEATHTQLFDPEEFVLKQRRFNKKHTGKRMLLQADLDGDQQKEFVFTNRFGSSIEFASANLRESTCFKPPDKYFSAAAPAYYKTRRMAQVAFHNHLGTLLLKVTANPLYNLKYFTWFLTYLLSVAFVALIMTIQNRRIAKRELLEQRLANLQLQNLRNQLDPHFTFNALNTVGNAIYKEDKQRAYDLFERFTRMIRFSLLDSKKVFRTLHEEISFTLDYLEFQKTRFGEVFDYRTNFETGLDLNKFEIPKMLVQSFAENAVKHAFHGIDYTGEIIIAIKQSGNRIIITIEDNGIGINRSKAEGNTAGTRQGENLLHDQVRQVNTLYNMEIRLTISDRNEKHPGTNGTRVEIVL